MWWRTKYSFNNNNIDKIVCNDTTNVFRNACESKEEMAAPFWANSTRGEVLALLNMYPFEQYIHLETCVHEKKQMYCREGCR